MNPGTLQFVGKKLLEFSYSQFLVYDNVEQQPACDWQQVHVAQGFARRESTVCFGTLLDYGIATVNVRAGKYEHDAAHERVISVPFHVRSGEVRIEGPDEHPIERVIRLCPGHYKMTAAQVILQNNEDKMVFKERVDLFLELLEEPTPNSEIVVVDEGLSPPRVLLEHADTMEV